jgi:PHD/YefM family antitoxin component YafN of YafNO toxin-antitoxin module
VTVMLVDTGNLVTEKQFREKLDKYVAAARKGQGPIAVTRDAEVLGFFISAEEYQTLYGVTIHELLTSRAKEETVSHEEARNHIRKTIKAASRKA